MISTHTHCLHREEHKQNLCEENWSLALASPWALSLLSTFTVSYRGFPTSMVYLYSILRVSDQNGVSLLYIMLEIHHSGREPSISCLR